MKWAPELTIRAALSFIESAKSGAGQRYLDFAVRRISAGTKDGKSDVADRRRIWRRPRVVTIAIKQITRGPIMTGGFDGMSMTGKS